MALTRRRVPRTSKPSHPRYHGIKAGFRSGLEETVSKQLLEAGIDPKYETIKLPYTVPEREAKYTPDFPVHSKIIIETKGRFLPADRKKMLLVRDAHPHLEFRFVFYNSRARIAPGSKTTLAQWATKNGFRYADKLVPEAWLQEIRNGKAHAG